MKKSLLLFLIFTSLFALVAAENMTTKDRNNDGRPDEWYEMKEGKIVKVQSDDNYDGKIDYVLEFTAGEVKAYEELDYNYDGEMDDFYFYEEGALVRREIDSNFDGKVDVWVFLEDGGEYISEYKMDTDFDGEVDKIKVY